MKRHLEKKRKSTLTMLLFSSQWISYLSMLLPKRADIRGRREVQVSSVNISALSVIITNTSATTCTIWLNESYTGTYIHELDREQTEVAYSIISHLLYWTYRVFNIVSFPISSDNLQIWWNSLEDKQRLWKMLQLACYLGQNQKL